MSKLEKYAFFENPIIYLGIKLTDFYSRADWADDEEFDDPSALPAQQITTNKDGTKTIVSYRFNDDGKKVKVTRRIRTTVVKEHVNPQVAERRAWSKFGLEKGHPPGPSFDTTSVGENIIFRPSVNWKVHAKEAEKEGEKGSVKDQLKDKKVKCRICQGEHFTARCPFKDTMAPVEESTGAAGAGLDDDEEPAVGGLSTAGGSYVPPHLRKGSAAAAAAAAGGGGGGGKYERDDLATLRVTNVSFPIYFSSTFFWTTELIELFAGLRIGRGAGTPRSIRTFRPCHQSFPCARQRYTTSKGICIYQFCRPRRCSPCVRKGGRM
jgi:translation initiation factor 3 subunit G